MKRNVLQVNPFVGRYIEFVGHFPTTSTGKVQKFSLRKAMETKLSLESNLNLEKRMDNMEDGIGGQDSQSESAAKRFV